MTGMKEGAGENPFAEDEPNEEPAETSNESLEHRGSERTSESRPSEESDGFQAAQIPYKFRRDGVQDGRDRVPLFLHEETKRTEREVLRELEDRLDENVSLTDLREAVVKVGLRRSDEVAVQLEEWGYGMTFDE